MSCSSWGWREELSRHWLAGWWKGVVRGRARWGVGGVWLWWHRVGGGTLWIASLCSGKTRTMGNPFLCSLPVFVSQLLGQELLTDRRTLKSFS